MNFWHQIAALLRPPEGLNPWQWAEKYRTLPRGVTAKPGPYSTDVTPWVREPQEAFLDPDVRVIVLQWARRMSKTESLLNLQGMIICDDPKGILVIYPTLDSAKNWSKRFFVPMWRATPVIRALIADPRSRDADNTTLSKGFPGGNIACIGTNSVSGFRQIQAPVIIMDEIDAMEDTSEGDPIALAFGRSENYPESVQVLSSTPTIKGFSRVEDWFLRSDQRKFLVPCQACGLMQSLVWGQLKWTDEKAEPRYECEGCGHGHDDLARRAMVQAGRWEATAGFDGVRGYHLNGLYNLFGPKKGFATRHHQFRAEFLEAKAGGRENFRVWTNQFLAETWEEQGDSMDPAGIIARAESYRIDAMPPGVLVITAGVDQQADRLECEVVGWGEEYEAWGLEYRVFWGSPDRPAVWQELDAYLAMTWPHPSGGELGVARAFVDAGDKQDHVLKFTKPRQSRGIYACRGLGQQTSQPPPLLPKLPSYNNPTQTPVWNVGVTRAKLAIRDRLALDPPGPRTFHWPHGCGYGADYYEMLTAEKLVTRYHHGQPYRIFILRQANRPNEALDCRVYALAAVHQLGTVHWAQIAEGLAAKGKKKAEDEQAEAPKPRRRATARRAGGTAVGGWR